MAFSCPYELHVVNKLLTCLFITFQITLPLVNYDLYANYDFYVL